MSTVDREFFCELLIGIDDFGCDHLTLEAQRVVKENLNCLIIGWATFGTLQGEEIREILVDFEISVDSEFLSIALSFLVRIEEFLRKKLALKILTGSLKTLTSSATF
jgi:hypothetical protein